MHEFKKTHVARSNRTVTLLLALLLVSLMLVVALSGCGLREDIPPKDAISAQEAQNIALHHAGLQLSEVRMDRADYDLDDGVPEYEIEFRKDKTEYDYTIHAVTGEVLAHHSERDFD